MAPTDRRIAISLVRAAARASSEVGDVGGGDQQHEPERGHDDARPLKHVCARGPAATGRPPVRRSATSCGPAAADRCGSRPSRDPPEPARDAASSRRRPISVSQLTCAVLVIDSAPAGTRLPSPSAQRTLPSAMSTPSNPSGRDAHDRHVASVQRRSACSRMLRIAAERVRSRAHDSRRRPAARPACRSWRA